MGIMSLAIAVGLIVKPNATIGALPVIVLIVDIMSVIKTFAYSRERIGLVYIGFLYG
jgi:hypothetical protein